MNEITALMILVIFQHVAIFIFAVKWANAKIKMRFEMDKHETTRKRLEMHRARAAEHARDLSKIQDILSNQHQESESGES